jgi:hypothetical protein
VPIIEGVLDPRTKVWQTIALAPLNIVYAVFIYDSTGRLIFSDPSLYSFTSDPVIATPDPLDFLFVVPTAAVPPPPTPDSVPSTNTVNVVYNRPTRANLTGTKNGVNLNFTIPSSGNVVLIIWNDTVLQSGIHYTISGTNITMLAPYIPQSGDILECLIWL